LLRIARRETGIRVYKPVTIETTAESAAARLRALVRVYARIFSPSPQKSFSSVVARHRDLGKTHATVADMIRSGELRTDVADGITYVSLHDLDGLPDIPREVRCLAPFDPLVWDRRRFAHLWGWDYRFEAYTPVAKRVRGYYAMPLLWGDDVIGWVNIGARGASSETVDVNVGFLRGRPRGREFGREFDAEIARVEQFLR
jgi:uncharacterized protein YcaQ